MSAVELEAADTFIPDTSSVAGWKFDHLDNDLGTTHIERELAKGRDEIFEHDREGGGSFHIYVMKIRNNSKISRFLSCLRGVNTTLLAI